MSDKLESLLTHIHEDASDIIQMVTHVESFECFLKNMPIRKAIIMSLLNIGEMVNRLPEEYVLAHRTIPWRSIVNLRNLAAHGYHVLNYDSIWQICQSSVPELLEFLETQMEAYKAIGP